MSDPDDDVLIRIPCTIVFTVILAPFVFLVMLFFSALYGPPIFYRDEGTCFRNLDTMDGVDVHDVCFQSCTEFLVPGRQGHVRAMIYRSEEQSTDSVDVTFGGKDENQREFTFCELQDVALSADQTKVICDFEVPDSKSYIDVYVTIDDGRNRSGHSCHFLIPQTPISTPVY